MHTSFQVIIRATTQVINLEEKILTPNGCPLLCWPSVLVRWPVPPLLFQYLASFLPGHGDIFSTRRQSKPETEIKTTHIPAKPGRPVTLLSRTQWLPCMWTPHGTGTLPAKVSCSPFSSRVWREGTQCPNPRELGETGSVGTAFPSGLCLRPMGLVWEPLEWQQRVVETRSNQGVGRSMTLQSLKMTWENVKLEAGHRDMETRNAFRILPHLLSSWIVDSYLALHVRTIFNLNEHFVIKRRSLLSSGWLYLST